MQSGLPLVLLFALSMPAMADSAVPLFQFSVPSLDRMADALGQYFTPGLAAAAFPGMRLPFDTSQTLTRDRPRLPVERPGSSLPTRFDFVEGPLTVAFGTGITTANGAQASIVPALPDPNRLGGAAGGRGQVRGQLGYHDGPWEFYGAHIVSVVQADGAPPLLHESMAVGSAYELPDWMAGGKVRASLEFSAKRTARLEFRQPLGPAEGYLIAERTYAPAEPAQPMLPERIRGGVARRF